MDLQRAQRPLKLSNLYDDFLWEFVPAAILENDLVIFGFGNLK
jgi:hypothetical protein